MPGIKSKNTGISEWSAFKQKGCPNCNPPYVPVRINKINKKTLDPVSYTHLDVYKRQDMDDSKNLREKDIAFALISRDLDKDQSVMAVL